MNRHTIDTRTAQTRHTSADSLDDAAGRPTGPHPMGGPRPADMFGKDVAE